jgi:type IV pilus assembly protein PilV
VTRVRPVRPVTRMSISPVTPIGPMMLMKPMTPEAPVMRAMRRLVMNTHRWSARASVPHKQCGTSLVEVLVAMVITVIGLLGLMALQMRAYSAESESYQRAHAAILLEDLRNRIEANRANAADYVAADVGVGAAEDCAGLTGAELDLCEWGNLLRGAAEIDEDDNRVGAMLLARGCVVSPAADVYVISVVWQGTNETAAPATTCGQGDYGNEALRRAVTAIVRIGDLDA